ncbi:uncharacterized protein LOC132648402 [Meriones unguiculatus]|uniref:uncharacterized protein LOC132648402 n=1 Tax=Meriones unguiculatus TaxID=10047 RepID=UPI00293F11E9|nr:uncharacterized protein LOC132648402 [Meriones unguiculatus]
MRLQGRSLGTCSDDPRERGRLTVDREPAWDRLKTLGSAPWVPTQAGDNWQEASCCAVSCLSKLCRALPRAALGARFTRTHTHTRAHAQRLSPDLWATALPRPARPPQGGREAPGLCRAWAAAEDAGRQVACSGGRGERGRGAAPFPQPPGRLLGEGTERPVAPPGRELCSSACGNPAGTRPPRDPTRLGTGAGPLRACLQRAPSGCRPRARPPSQNTRAGSGLHGRDLRAVIVQFRDPDYICSAHPRPRGTGEQVSGAHQPRQPQTPCSRQNPNRKPRTRDPTQWFSSSITHASIHPCMHACLHA